MPIDEKQLLWEIKKAGCSVLRTRKGHFLVLDSHGNPIEGYAVRHGKAEVLNIYVQKVRKALQQLGT